MVIRELAYILNDSFDSYIEYIKISCFQGRFKRYDNITHCKVKNYTKQELKELKNKCKYFKIHRI